MIELFSHNIEQPSIEFQRLSWTIKPTTEDISLYTFVILRSNSPEGPFDLIKEIHEFHYDDFSINQKNANRIFYYKLRIAKALNEYQDYGPWYLTQSPDPIALELIRKKNVALFYGSTPALPVDIFIRKTWGTYCPECFDHIKQRSLKSNCVTCYNTNYIGGFFTPVSTRGFFGPEDKIINQLGFEVNSGSVFIETANYPILSPGDIIKQDMITRFRIVAVKCTRRSTYIISQFAQVEVINHNDIEYEL